MDGLFKKPFFEYIELLYFKNSVYYFSKVKNYEYLPSTPLTNNVYLSAQICERIYDWLEVFKFVK